MLFHLLELSMHAVLYSGWQETEQSCRGDTTVHEATHEKRMHYHRCKIAHNVGPKYQIRANVVHKCDEIVNTVPCECIEPVQRPDEQILMSGRCVWQKLAAPGAG